MVTSGVARYGVRSFVFLFWYVKYAKSIGEGFLLEVSEPSVAYVIKRLVSKYLEERLVVYCDDEVLTPQNEVS